MITTQFFRKKRKDLLKGSEGVSVGIGLAMENFTTLPLTSFPLLKAFIGS